MSQLLVSIALSALSLAGADPYDVLVYGSTPGAVTAAVAAARRGASVLLLDPAPRVGGMCSGGLGRTDRGNSIVIGGLAKEFFARNRRVYHPEIPLWKPMNTTRDVLDGFYLEPHVAEQLFLGMLCEANVTHLATKGAQVAAVTKAGARITSVTLTDGSAHSAAIFVDGTYEGDLMARSGAAFTWGREAAAQYNESYAGVKKSPFTPSMDIGQFSPYDYDEATGRATLIQNGGLITEEQSLPAGTADNKVQGYNFRLCVTANKSNAVPFPKPHNYNRSDWKLLLKQFNRTFSKLPASAKLLNVNCGAVPLNKYDMNNGAFISTDWTGGSKPLTSWLYPNATYEQQKIIRQQHEDYQKGMIWTYAHDPAIPKTVRDKWTALGLCKDEFVSNNNWPEQLYIREARRLVGGSVYTQNDVLAMHKYSARSIGMGSYNFDAHYSQRGPCLPDPPDAPSACRDGAHPCCTMLTAKMLAAHPMTPRQMSNDSLLWVGGEGFGGDNTKLYEFPYEILLPKREEVTNLLCPLTPSVSHIALATVRMEPQFMTLGHSAGVAAALAASTGSAVQDVDLDMLHARLLADNQTLSLPPPPPPPPAGWECVGALGNRCIGVDRSAGGAHNSSSCNAQCKALAADEWLANIQYWRKTEASPAAGGQRIVATSNTVLKKSTLKSSRLPPSEKKAVASGTGCELILLSPCVGCPRLPYAGYWLCSIKSDDDEVSQPQPVRVTTADGALSLQFGASTGAVTAVSIGGVNVSGCSLDVWVGGFSLHEQGGGAQCPPSSGTAAAPAQNVSLLLNGEFSQQNGSTPAVAQGWAPYGNGGYTRVTASNSTRPGHAAAIELANTVPTGVAGAAQVWRPSAAEQHAPFAALVLSGWSLALRDTPTNKSLPLDYSVYADVLFTDGSALFGEAAPFAAGAHGWQRASKTVPLSGAKHVSAVHVYAMYRNRAGKVCFSSLSVLGVRAPCMPRANVGGAAVAVPSLGGGDGAAVNLRTNVAPPQWRGTRAGVTATFSAAADHIKVVGAIALTHAVPCPYPQPCPKSDSVADRALSLTLSFPLDGAGWKLWADAETHVVLPSAAAAKANNGSSALFGGQSVGIGQLPNKVDRYPLLVLTSADGARGLALALPMASSQVFISRIRYDAVLQLLCITFDLGLTSRSRRWQAAATFSCLLFPLAQPKWGFRSALSQYYSLHPDVWGPERTMKRQGIWTACVRDVASIPKWEDFGIAYAEESFPYNASQSIWMNAQGIGIYPYIEPPMLHWPLPAGSSQDWPAVNASVTECAAGLGRCTTAAARCAAEAIASSATVDLRSGSAHWIYAKETEPWNYGAVFYPNLSPASLANNCSAASCKLAEVDAAQNKAAAEGYELAGQYTDSTFGFNSEFNGYLDYRSSSLHTAVSPPVFDAAGRVVALMAQSELAFLALLARKLHARGQHLFGNGLYGQGTPHYQAPAVFDVAGTEIDFQTAQQQTPENGVFTPPPQQDLQFARAMSGAKPYLYLLDTNFDTWSMEYTSQYMQICLLYGIWPSFFSANAASHVYWNNATLRERDRSLFQFFIPILRSINHAGWQPLTHASAAGWQIERYGSMAPEATELFFALRRSNTTSAAASAAASAGSTLTVEVASLGLAPNVRGYAVTELAQRPAEPLPRLVVSAAATSELRLPISAWAHNATVVLVVDLRKRILKTDDDMRTLSWANRTWQVRGQGSGGPGPNKWSDSAQNAAVSADGTLHLSATKNSGAFECVEISLSSALGYGQYEFDVQSDVSALCNSDPNTVLGLFLYHNDTLELDIEFARWGKPASASRNNADYVNQPGGAGRSEYWPQPPGEATTHRIDFRKKAVLWSSFKTGQPGSPYEIYNSTKDVPPAEGMLVHINLWMFRGKSTCADSNVSVALTDFRFTSTRR